MRPLQGESLLEAWEAGANQAYLARTLTLLQLAHPEMPADELMALSIPQLNLQLLRLRQISFGSTLSGFVPCPECGTRLELSIPVAALIEQMEPLAARDEMCWSEGTAKYALRPLTVRDLMMAQSEDDSGNARSLLLGRCLSVTGGDNPTGVPEHSAMTMQKFDELHAGAEITLQMDCPSCLRSHSADLDIARFLWAEVRHAAVRLLRETHEIASTYGWSERAILLMTAQRRSAYLEMIRG